MCARDGGKHWGHSKNSAGKPPIPTELALWGGKNGSQTSK